MTGVNSVEEGMTASLEVVMDLLGLSSSAVGKELKGLSTPRRLDSLSSLQESLTLMETSPKVSTRLSEDDIDPFLEIMGLGSSEGHSR